MRAVAKVKFWARDVPSSSCGGCEPTSRCCAPTARGCRPCRSNGNPGKTWCVAKPGSPGHEVTNALNFACGEGGVDCGAIQTGGACFSPNTLASHASFAYNVYYQKMGRNYWNCYFGGTGVITITDPSYAGSMQLSLMTRQKRIAAFVRFRFRE